MLCLLIAVQLRFAHHVTSPTLSMVQYFISIGQGFTVWRGFKNRMFSKESGVVHNTALRYRACCDGVRARCVKVTALGFDEARHDKGRL
jgi:hypothetical protein